MTDPMNIPEILSTVFNFLDLETLKSCRTVSKAWNDIAGKFLSNSSRVILMTSGQNPQVTYRDNKIERLKSTLSESDNPSYLFRRLDVREYQPKSIPVEKILQTKGMFLHTFAYTIDSLKSNILPFKSGSFYIQTMIVRILDEMCPTLQEFHLTIYGKNGDAPNNPTYPKLHFNGSSKLTTIKLSIKPELDKYFQDFLAEIFEQASELKFMSIFKTNTNERLYEKLFQLQTNVWSLKGFYCKGQTDNNVSKIISKLEQSNELTSLCLNRISMDQTDLIRMLDSTKTNLKLLSLKQCSFENFERNQFNSEIFNLIIHKLKNLETLNLTIDKMNEIFPNIKNDCITEHKNLKKFLTPWYSMVTLSTPNLFNPLSKWFPNLMILSIGFTDCRSTDTSRVNELTFQDIVATLTGLKLLTNVCLRKNMKKCHDEQELQQTLKAFNDLPSVQCCTLCDLSNTWPEETPTYSLDDLKQSFPVTSNMNLIRLIGFNFEDKESIIDFAKTFGTSLKIYRGTNCDIINNKDTLGLTTRNNQDPTLFDPSEYLI